MYIVKQNRSNQCAL